MTALETAFSIRILGYSWAEPRTVFRVVGISSYIHMFYDPSDKFRGICMQLAVLSVKTRKKLCQCWSAKKEETGDNLFAKFFSDVCFLFFSTPIDPLSHRNQANNKIYYVIHHLAAKEHDVDCFEVRLDLRLGNNVVFFRAREKQRHDRKKNKRFLSFINICPDNCYYRIMAI